MRLVPQNQKTELIAYLQGEHPLIAEGVCLKDVKIVADTASNGETLNIVNSYQIVA